VANNCPENSWCGAPFLNDTMKDYEWNPRVELYDNEAFNYGITNFDNIGYSILVVF
jgi:hypothetical protein